MMDVWIVLSLTALAVLLAGAWIRERILIRRARRQLAATDHSPIPEKKRSRR
jgi:hypothetical protein